MNIIIYYCLYLFILIKKYIKIETLDVLIYLRILDLIKDDGAKMFVDNLIKLN